MDFHYDIDFIFPNDEPPFDSSSDNDEMELTLAIAIEELKNEGASTSCRRSVQPRRNARKYRLHALEMEELSKWKGQYIGHTRDPTIILEIVASYDLWIWHAFFGLPGSHNDINVLERSSVFSELAEGCAPPVNYSINGNNYSMRYYLTDGIYPSWATFVKTIPAPQDRKRQHFASAQEAVRKDVEHAYGVLQVRFAIVRGPAHFFHLEMLKDIMMACIILHNMIVEDELHTYLGANDLDYDQINDNGPEPVSHNPTYNLMQFIECHNSIRDRGIHS
ncbi:uncharacterized protein LOC115949720 [Quercus lobata]|uniref:uncharacterized protein LOC115949720 n=1 Tax=Quercus lobata TaxID=97700 RepID=UPI0012440A5D|nr:uncharacterized protein LOC115949720 [Quercus lobata]